jgi:hypothetical protein
MKTAAWPSSSTPASHDNKTPVYAEPRYFQQEADLVKFRRARHARRLRLGWRRRHRSSSAATPPVTSPSSKTSAAKASRSRNGPRPSKLKAAGKSHPPHGRQKRQHPRPLRGQMGLHHANRGRLGSRRIARSAANSILGKVVWFKNIGTRQKPNSPLRSPSKSNGTASSLNSPTAGCVLKAKRCSRNGAPRLSESIGTRTASPTSSCSTKKATSRSSSVRSRGNSCSSIRSASSLRRKDAQKHYSTKPSNISNVKTPVAMKLANRCASTPASLAKAAAANSASWTGISDGQLDILLNSANANFLRQVAAEGKWFFTDMGLLSDANIEGHDVEPHDRRFQCGWPA